MKKINKNIILTLGMIATIATPITAVVSCGTSKHESVKKDGTDSQNKPADSQNKPTDSQNKPTDSQNKPADSQNKSTVKPTDQTTVKPADKTTVKTTVKPTDQTTVKPTDQTTVKPTDQTTVKPTDQTTVKPTDQTTVKPTDQTTDTGEKSETKKGTKEELRTQLDGLIGITGISEDIKSNIVPLAEDFLLNGIKSVKEENLNSLLNNFGLSNNIIDMIHKFLIKDGKIDDTLIKMLFNDGFKGLIDKNNSQYFDDLLSKVIHLLPSGITKEIPMEFIKKVLQGMDHRYFGKFLTKKFDLNVLTSSLGGSFYSELPILKPGIISATAKDWKDTINGIATNWKSFGSFIEDKLPTSPKSNKNWQLKHIVSSVVGSFVKLDSTGDLDKVTQGIAHLLNSGVNSMTNVEIKYIINLFNWAKDFHQGDIFESEKQKLKDDLKNIIKKQDLKDQQRNPVDLSPIDKATTYNDIIDAAKSIKGYTEIIVGTPGTEVTGLTAQEIYTSLKNDRIMYWDIYGPSGVGSTDYGILGDIEGAFNELDQHGRSKGHALYDGPRDRYHHGRKELPFKDIFKSITKKIDKFKHQPEKLWPLLDDLIKKAKTIKGYRKYGNKPIPEKTDVDKALSKSDRWNGTVKALKAKLENLYSSNDLNVDDKLNVDSLDHIFTMQGIFDKVNEFVKDKTLYRGKVLSTTPDEIIVSKKIDSYLSNNVKSFHFHINKIETINKYKKDINSILEKVKIKKSGSDNIATSSLDLTSLDKKETIQDITKEVDVILKANITKGLFKEDGTTSLTIDQVDKLLPVEPTKELGNKLSAEVLKQEIDGDFKMKLIYQVLNKSKLFSKFLLEGVPKTQPEWESLRDSLLAIAKPILITKGIDIPIVVFKGMLNDIFDLVKGVRHTAKPDINKA